MSRPMVTVNFDNELELLDYINSKGNRAEFIRYCIRKEMGEEKKGIQLGAELDARIENIVKKCLTEHVPVQTHKEVIEVDNDLVDIADFFEED